MALRMDGGVRSSAGCTDREHGETNTGDEAVADGRKIIWKCESALYNVSCIKRKKNKKAGVSGLLENLLSHS